jgi:AcrR family transcriptional regulator
MNPSSSPRRARTRAQRRLAFLAAAAGVFGARGYHGASMADIARAADAATGTLYLYFQNKEELYVALLEEKILELSREVKGRPGMKPRRGAGSGGRCGHNWSSTSATARSFKPSCASGWR